MISAKGYKNHHHHHHPSVTLTGCDKNKPSEFCFSNIFMSQPINLFRKKTFVIIVQQLEWSGSSTIGYNEVWLGLNFTSKFRFGLHPKLMG